MDKKQKNMLAVLVALVIGMGGVWFFVLRDSSESRVAEGPPQARKVKVRDTANKKKSGRKKRDRKAKATVQRRERDMGDRNTGSKRKKKRNRGGIEKKRKLQPAA